MYPLRRRVPFGNHDENRKSVTGIFCGIPSSTEAAIANVSATKTLGALAFGANISRRISFLRNLPHIASWHPWKWRSGNGQMIKNIGPDDLHVHQKYEVAELIGYRSVAQFAFCKVCREWWLGRAAIRKPWKIDLEDQRGEFRVLRWQYAQEISGSHVMYFRSCISLSWMYQKDGFSAVATQRLQPWCSY